MRTAFFLLGHFSVLFASARSAHAEDLRLATLFSDHMVLQRDKPVPIWGWADAGDRITVKFGNQAKTTQADSNGKWLVKLEPLAANASAQSLTVQGKTTISVADVLVGEVWLGSGQSNMAMTVGQVNNAEDEKAAADLPLIRLFTEESGSAETPQSLGKGAWKICSPNSVSSFSATLYFFGREIHRSLDVPVGLVNSSVGGTPIESWIDVEAQALSPELASLQKAAASAQSSADDASIQNQYDAEIVRWRVAAKKARAAREALPSKPVNPLEKLARKRNVGGLFNGKIAPLYPYAIRGILWYQGEANSMPDKGFYYRHQLPLLVADWRSHWGEDIPFAWVQLPNYERRGVGWSLVREGMMQTLRLPNTGMAVTLDIGDAQDIHPKNKQEVGKRLARWALVDVYGQKQLGDSMGPIIAGHEIVDGKIIVRFEHADEGFRELSKSNTAEFLIAGEDKIWHPATVRIDGKTIVATSDQVAKPIALRYAWKSNPACVLYGQSGLPASPFRTDDWSVDEAQ